MEIDKEYMYFKRWYKESERSFHCSQMDEEDIAYSAFIEGKKYFEKNFIPNELKGVSNNEIKETDCKCISRQPYLLPVDECIECGTLFRT